MRHRHPQRRDDSSSTRSPTAVRSHGASRERNPDHHESPRDDVRPTRPSERGTARCPVEMSSLEMLGLLAAGDPCESVYHSENWETHTCRERKRFEQLVRRYSEELDIVVVANSQHAKPSCRLNLLEVFCGPKSQLIHQVEQLGFKAERLEWE